MKIKNDAKIENLMSKCEAESRKVRQLTPPKITTQFSIMDFKTIFSGGGDDDQWDDNTSLKS